MTTHVTAGIPPGHYADLSCGCHPIVHMSGLVLHRIVNTPDFTEAQSHDRYNIVNVQDSDAGWIAYCRECHCTVSLKAIREDAELGAARHIARVHWPELPALATAPGEVPDPAPEHRRGRPVHGG